MSLATLLQKGAGMEFDRRSFLKGAALLGGASAMAGLAGCAPQSQSSQDAGAGASSSSARDAFEAAAAPIDPVEPPASWDEEVEIVVVGSGAGGMNASIRLAQAGYQVVCLERLAETGGNSKHSSVFSNFGGHKQAEALQWAYPSYPYDVDSIVEFMLDCQQNSGDPDLLRAMATEGPTYTKSVPASFARLKKCIGDPPDAHAGLQPYRTIVSALTKS